MTRNYVTIDGNEAAADVAYQTNECIAIYPITPASPMGELADEWASKGRKNIFGTVPHVVEMQSEAGAAGAVHGALQAGSMTATFTASQGLLLMIPNMFKIAGELTPMVLHVAARSVAAHALSIFGEHSDVMATRMTGFGTIFSNNVQEAADLALIAQMSTLESRVPFLHFFDGFRTSHEVAKVERLAPADIAALIDSGLVRAHRARALTPDHPLLRGSAQNPDVFFQARERSNPYYLACPEIVQGAMDRFAARLGRAYHLFDYVGHPEAQRVVVMMGSGCGAAEEAVHHLADQGQPVGLLKVRLFRPWSVSHFVAALPATTQAIAVLDRTKEPGAAGEPLYQDVVTALAEATADGTLKVPHFPRVIGGRYGLSSKELTPAMVKGVLDELSTDAPKNHFTVGINDDVTHTSLAWDPSFSTEPDDVVRAVFYGLGSDGTVGANKNSIKIIGEETPNWAQGYFVYDSKKAGSVTVSHLRFGPRPITSSYLITKANFVACHQWPFLERVDVLEFAEPGATFLLNSPFSAAEIWAHLPRKVQQGIIDKGLRVFTIDADKVAKDAGMGRRINTIMQTCFFGLSGVLPRDEAIEAIEQTIKKTYGKLGESVVAKNIAAVDAALANLEAVSVPAEATSSIGMITDVPAGAPEFVRQVTAPIMFARGESLPVSVMPEDGTFPTGTARWEKRNIALEVPVWDPDTCIQCGKCVLVCPHATIRSKVYPEGLLASAPAGFKATAPRFKQFKSLKYTLQVAVEDCTGCGVCVDACPAKNKSETKLKAINMATQLDIREQERRSWDFFLSLPEADRAALKPTRTKDVQLYRPYFEFPGSCAGCGETNYVRLVSQLFGDRMMVANATGCSSIYGGNLPTTPWSKDEQGRGPSWANSLFEDNAEFGLGMRQAVDKQVEYASELVERLSGTLGAELAGELLAADQTTEAGIAAQRARVARLKAALADVGSPEALDLLALADQLVRKSLWILGGDGWAYDIGYGGLDHVLASRFDVNVLVMDTEVYSNTGGQMSKATPRAAVAKFAAGGKPSAKKDLALMAMSYGTAYVAQVAMGADEGQLLKALGEAESYRGPSLVIAYSHCIAHGYDLVKGLGQQKAAVDSGHWPLFRYDPRRAAAGQNPLLLDSKAPTIELEQYIYNETRYTQLVRSKPEAAKALLASAKADAAARWKRYELMARQDSEGTA